ncbi:MAG: DUF3347 domain-containing protein [Bacteroidia bacterium]|nr:DUF3347 domain-containing protein [Bacteroidia bacterium]
MKNIIIGLVIASTTLTFCNSNQSTGDQNKSNRTRPVSQTENAILTASSVKEVENVVSIKEIISAYLQMKNAFTEDNSAGAASAGKKLQTVFRNFDKSSLTSIQKKTYEDAEADAIEHAEHIGANGGKIAHQREHFDLLSKDIYDLVKAFGGGQVLYWDFDSMPNNGKGAYWLSETKEIKNPYMGKAMLTAGSTKEEIK